MRLFLDTEFTGLIPGARLISLALVSEDQRAIYIELADGWDAHDCTDWVRMHVLPKLERTPATTCTHAEATSRLRTFLDGFPEAVICFDSEHDRNHLLSLLDPLPEHVALENINREIEQAVFDGYFGNERHRKHHALTDARALEHAYRACWEMRLRSMRDRDDNS